MTPASDDCPRCSGTGEVRTGASMQTCPVCHGSTLDGPGLARATERAAVRLANGLPGPGRPREADARRAVISVRMTAADRADCRAAADRAGQPLSEWALRALRAASVADG